MGVQSYPIISFRRVKAAEEVIAAIESTMELGNLAAWGSASVVLLGC